MSTNDSSKVVQDIKSVSQAIIKFKRYNTNPLFKQWWFSVSLATAMNRLRIQCKNQPNPDSSL